MALLCYEELLKHQPETYKKHVRWLKWYWPQEVRSALVVARTEGETKLDRFEAELKAARWQLRGDEAAKAAAEEAEEPKAKEPEA
jgi:glycine cleavage system protein P-like pyridoxal-binding family